MYEQEKIKEAEYFLLQMIGEKGNPEVFRYNLSAFLTAARSVLQYSLEEARSKRGGEDWYNGQVRARPVIRFLKDKRDINIHTQPVIVERHITLKLFDGVRVSDTAFVSASDQNGNVIGRGESSQSPRRKVEVETPSAAYEYFFDDWGGSEDVITLCQQYLDEVKLFLKDGIANGFITDK